MEDNEAALRSLIKEIKENSKDHVDRLLRMEATLKSLQGSLDRSEESLEEILFTLSRAVYYLVQANKTARYAVRWSIIGIVFGISCVLLSLIYSLHTSRKVAKDLEEHKIELMKTVNELTLEETQPLRNLLR